jgi:propanediol dehydratase small subunit
MAELGGLSYPLAATGRDAVHTAKGRAVSAITLDALLAGELGPGDVAVASETLLLQAEFAEEAGNPQLAENLRRGAELVAFSDDDVRAFYEMLRPGRSSAEELDGLAETLAERGAERCAGLVREARAAYVRRGLIA